jgi:hypothetical protein
MLLEQADARAGFLPPAPATANAGQHIMDFAPLDLEAG